MFKLLTKTILYVLLFYFYILFVLNFIMWFITDESIELYHPIWNLIDLK